MTKQIYSISILSHWTSGEQVAKLWSYRFSHPSFRVIFWDLLDEQTKKSNPPDYWVIINYPNIFQPLYHQPILSKTVVFEMEPIRFWKDLDSIESSLFKVFSHQTDYNNIEWHLDMTMDEIDKPIIKDETKSDRVSAILSPKYFDPGHIKRIDFVKYVESKGLFEFDIYGTNSFNYKNYYGLLPSHIKNDGMFPYKYHFAVENHSKPNYFTEKIVDAILSECVCFYWGCPNISEFIDSRAYIVLDLGDVNEHVKEDAKNESCMKLIKEAIQNNEWEKRIDTIRQEKRKLMFEMNMLNRLQILFDSKL